MRYANRLAMAGLFVASCLAAAVPARAQGEPPQLPREGGSPVPSPSGQGLLASAQNPLLGGVPSGQVTPGVLPLSLSDALARSLKQNLGIILGEQSREIASASRWMALGGVLPSAGLRLGEAREKINLEEFGFPVGPGQSPIIGPFNVASLHLNVSQAIFDYAAIQGARAGSQAATAAGHTFKDVRDMVVFMTANLYLQTVTASSRIDAARAQLNTAQALYDRAVSMKQAGVVPGIEVLRAQVQLQSQQQRVIFYENELAKAKLTLQRAIGVPLGQQVQLTDPVPYAPLGEESLDAFLKQAHDSREDLQAAAALLKAAEANRRAAIGELFPTVRFNGDFGRSSATWDALKGTYAVSATVTVPLFQAGQEKGRIVEADARLRQQQAQYLDLQARVDYEVRSAMLDVQAADRRVQVARSAADLANQQLTQAQDRFTAGVTGNIEVVQAQEALATATENYLAALYAHNLAKISVARAIGLSEERAGRFLGGK